MQIEEMQGESGIRSDDGARERSREVMKDRQVEEGVRLRLGWLGGLQDGPFLLRVSIKTNQRKEKKILPLNLKKANSPSSALKLRDHPMQAGCHPTASSVVV